VGGDLEELAQMQYGLADLYINWHNYSRARELLSEAIGTFRRKRGARLAIAYETLAHVEECSGRYYDALKNLALAGKV
jgi:Tfp pilus assembly protein PilF